MPNETRKQATDRVTAAVVQWLWKRGCRSIAHEVGFRPQRGLVTSWRSSYRVDLAAVAAAKRKWPARVYIVEVKGTRADLTREHLDKPYEERARLLAAKHKRGRSTAALRWSLDLARWGIAPWLAIDDSIPVDAYAFLPPEWGVLRVKGLRVKVERKPTPFPVAGDDNTALAWKAVSEIHTLQRLPRMNRRSPDQILAEMQGEEYGRRWVAWASKVEKLIQKEDDDGTIQESTSDNRRERRGKWHGVKGKLKRKRKGRRRKVR